MELLAKNIKKNSLKELLSTPFLISLFILEDVMLILLVKGVVKEQGNPTIKQCLMEIQIME